MLMVARFRWRHKISETSSSLQRSDLLLCLSINRGYPTCASAFRSTRKMNTQPSAQNNPSVTLHLIRSPSNLGHYVRDSTSAPPIPSSLPLSTVIDDVQIHQHPKGKYSKNNQRAPTPRATIHQRCLGHVVRVGDEPPALRGLVRGQRDDKD